MEKISKHISYKEGIKSNTAMRLNIDNSPGEYHLGNMNAVAINVFEPLREWVNGPIKINSFYRSVALNKAIGGSSRSQHCEKENLSFDQMIWEFGTDKNPDWVHISYVSEEQNRNRCLKATRVNGKAVYSII